MNSYLANTCAEYKKTAIHAAASVLLLSGLLGYTSCAKKPDIDDTYQEIARYSSIEDKLINEQHIVDMDRLDLFIAYDTLSGFGKMRTISRNEKGGNPVETVFIDDSKICDTLSCMRYDEDGFMTFYLPQCTPGKRMIISGQGSQQMRVSWNAADEPRFKTGNAIPVRLQRWFPGNQSEDRFMTSEEVNTAFRDAFDYNTGKFKLAQQGYLTNLRLLRNQKFKMDKPAMQQPFLRRTSPTKK